MSVDFHQKGPDSLLMIFGRCFLSWTDTGESSPGQHRMLGVLQTMWSCSPFCSLLPEGIIPMLILQMGKLKD